MTTKTKQSIQKIAEENLGLVRQQAHKFRGSDLSFDELVSIGTIGLMKAIKNRDESNPAAFSSYAIPYIRGEILHYFRDKKGELVRSSRGEHAPFVNSLDTEIPGTESLTMLDAIADPTSNYSEDWDLLNSLESPYKDVLILSKVDGLTNSAIAKKFQVSPVTISNWIKKAQRYLKDFANSEDSRPLRGPNAASKIRLSSQDVIDSGSCTDRTGLTPVQFKGDTLWVGVDEINQLREIEKRVVELTMIAGLKPKQVADRLGMRPSYVSALRREAFHNLRRIKTGIPMRSKRIQSDPDRPSESELEVLRLLQKGLSTKEIAAQRFCCTRTVETHIQNLNRKAGITNNATRIKLVSWGAKNGYCDPIENEPVETPPPARINSKLKTELLAQLALGIDAHHQQVQAQFALGLAQSKAELISQIDRCLDLFLQP